jgi:hypothetical protein
MTASLSSRRLCDGTYLTARSSVPFPFPLDVDLAAQLIAVTLAQAALAATHRAIDSAHPALSLTTVHARSHQLTDSERLAVVVLQVGNQLAILLADYAAAVIQDSVERDDDLPF